jgi:hypothetical protein
MTEIEEIQELNSLRKTKQLTFVEYHKRLKSIKNRYKRQLKRKNNFINKYGKYDSYEPMLNLQNYIDSFYKCRSTSQWKRSYQIYNANLIKEIAIIYHDMLHNILNTAPHKNFKVNERGKIRKISAPDIKERIIQHNLCTNILHPISDHSLIYDNYASQKNKGLYLARKRIKKFMVSSYKHNKTNAYVLKLDIHHFFDSIKHKYVLNTWSKYISDYRVLNLIQQILMKNAFHKDVGLCLGSEVSQISATLFLSKLDHLIKEKFRIKYYCRYNDDILIIHNSKTYLEKTLNFIIDYLNTIELSINTKKTRIFSISKGFNILKVKYFYDRYKNNGKVIMLSGRESAKRERRKLRKLKTKYLKNEISKTEILNLFLSWSGNILKSFNAYNLYKQNYIYFKKLIF